MRLTAFSQELGTKFSEKEITPGGLDQVAAFLFVDPAFLIQLVESLFGPFPSHCSNSDTVILISLAADSRQRYRPQSGMFFKRTSKITGFDRHMLPGIPNEAHGCPIGLCNA